MEIKECLLNEFWVPFNPEVTAANNHVNSDIRPCKFDQKWDFWFERIGRWGKLNIYHTDPEKKIRKESITQSKFIKLIGTADLMKLYGKFIVELRGVDEVDFIRNYVGIDGKSHDEIFKVKVDLKPSLKKGFRFWDGIFS